jgi:hypothetical protein
MQLFLCRRTVVSAWLAALALTLAAPAAGATALPERPIKKSGFRLLARASGSLKVNQVQCGLISNGQICVDSTGSSTIPGSVWPKGTNNQYTFNSGISLAGIVGDEMPAWAGDTIGAFFFEGSGFLLNGEQVEPIYNASDAADAAQWPEFAKVPGVGDSVSSIYDPLLQNQISASQGDVYFLTWDGNPARVNGRIHPMGVVVETRGLAWNYPAGNQDIIYFIYTLYNVSSIDPADYVNIRPSLRDRLLQQATTFQATNEAAFGVDIPDHGYSLTDVFMNFGADQDVTVNAGADYATFNNLFNLAITYEEKFEPQPGNVFDPGIHAPPFLPGPGFVGTKYLRSPILPTGEESGTVLAGLTTNRGAFPDPNNAQQLYRYISGNLNSAAGDPQCNTGDPKVTHLCFINNVPSDTRTFQSSGPLTLPAGGQATIVVAYIFAPPVQTGKCPSIPCPVTMAPRPLLIANASPASPGVDAIDSAMGYRGFLGQTVTQDSVRTVPNSLLDKAKVAQAIFDSKFLLPFAPTSPDFFLIPGDQQVTILWRPSRSEAEGDAYFAIANDPTQGARYDPAYRQFDVEGYRIYRGRTDTPNQLELVAQFDYTGTQIFDFQGTVNPNETCGPELGINAGCAAPFPATPPVAPARYTDSVGVELNGPIVQVRPGQRVALTNGTVRTNNGPNAVDTLVTGANSGFPELANTGVPFVYADNGSGLLSAPRNNVRYFYSVTAFDVNSFVSGPASLEAQRAAKPIVPVKPASNAVVSSTVTPGFFGRDVALTDSTLPTIDPATGKFSGPFPPANGQTLGFLGDLATNLFSEGGQVAATLIGVGLGDARDAVPALYTFETRGVPGTDTVSLTIDPGTGFGEVSGATTPFAATLANEALAAKYGASPGPVPIAGQITMTDPNYQQTVAWGRGCAGEGGVGLGLGDASNCSYNGERWFAGDNETMDNPNFGSATDGSGVPPGTNLNNAGELPGVATIYAPHSYLNIEAGWRAMEASLGGAARAGDFKVYWGNPGKVDSVIDVSHNVPVPFIRDSMGAGFGILNVSGSSAAGSNDARPTVVSVNDLGCMEPWRSGAAGTGANGVWTACASAAPFFFSDSAELNQVAIYTGALTNAATVAPRPNPGFLFYLAGRVSMIELSAATLPTQTVWTLRSYVGYITGGNGAGGSLGAYAFTPATRPLTALGAELRIDYAVTNEIRASTKEDLSLVHTVPDPYYVTNSFETTTTDKIIRFVNLPERAIIRIYSSSGVLVQVLEHNSSTHGATTDAISVGGGQETWNVRNRNNQVVASGVYFYHIEAGDARRVGRFTVVNFAQ